MFCCRMAQSVVQLLDSDKTRMNVFSLGAIPVSESSAIDAFEELGLVPLVVCCPSCGPNAILQAISDGSGGKLGYRWNCPVCRSQGRQWRFSPTANTLFDKSHLTFVTTFKLAYCWFLKMTVSNAAAHCEITVKAAIKFYHKLRRACLTMVNHDPFPIGQNGDIVEVDESHLFTRKYHRGRILKRQMWVFGGICRRTGKVFVQLIMNKKKTPCGPSCRSQLVRTHLSCQINTALIFDVRFLDSRDMPL